MGYLVAYMYNNTWTKWISPAGGCGYASNL